MADKLKRGVAVTVKETGETLYVQIDRQDGTILLRDTPNESPQAIYFDTVLSNITTERKFAAPIKNKPKQSTGKEADEKKLLNQFFDKVSLRMPTNCMECNQPLQAFNKFAKRSCSAHVLPKSQFPSIARNELNIIYLGAGFLGGCDCHGQYDSNVDARVKMKVYKIALQRFDKLAGELTPKELVKAYTYLKIDWQ